jgi:alpha-methylacyl-CoA racemase
MSGPLAGSRVVEIGGIGPAPYCAMVLADMGADVIRVDRVVEVHEDWPEVVDTDLLYRGRRSVAVDLKRAEGAEVALRLATRADVLIEGFRPGVAERLGIGPDDCAARNARLVYARLTGWGQEGPWAQRAGHDINYVALGGALAMIGRAGETPLAPPAMFGDFAGGGLLCAFGIACALIERERSGQGQVVDAAVVDGVAMLLGPLLGPMRAGWWVPRRGENLIDTGAPFYEVYETKDGEYISLGAIEPEFYAELVKRLGVDELPEQMDRDRWPDTKMRIAELVRERTRAEWEAVFEGSDACFAPVLAPHEAARHPHMAARQTYAERHNALQAAPAPRFSRTPAALQRPAARPGQHTIEVLSEWGFETAEIEGLRASGSVRQQ